MDPDTNLAEQIALAKKLLMCNELLGDTGGTDHRLAELVIALDGWIVGGGFLPKAWQKE